MRRAVPPATRTSAVVAEGRDWPRVLPGQYNSAPHVVGQMSMGAPRDDPHTLPRLPVLGWSSFSGAYRAPLPDVSNARQWRYTISGRAAIGLALRVLGVEAGTPVLVPTYHCP